MTGTGTGTDTKLRYPEWSDLLSVGNAEIDEEHRRFLAQVALVARMIDAGNLGLAKDTAAAMLALLRDHFKTEERVFALTSYPHAETHRTEHQVLLHMARNTLSDIRYRDDLDYVSLSLRYLAQMTVEHLIETDMGYKPYLAAAG